MTMEKRSLPTLNHVLQHTLRSLCSDSQWVYAIFWRILPRNYPPPKWENESGAIDRSKGNKRNWILVWEDGFCDFQACSSGKEAGDSVASRYGTPGLNQKDQETTESAAVMHPELFFKMSHEVYNYGEGLMGKVAADNSHKWVYREPMEHEFSFLSPWHGSLDPHPRTWEAQFKAGIQTIAVISVREGLIQLGSIKKVVEDLNFVILMQRKFNYLQSIPGVFVPHPSPLPGGAKRCKDGANGESPPAVGTPFWKEGVKDQSFSPGRGLFSRSPGIETTAGFQIHPQTKHFVPGVLGVKRPSDTDYPTLGLMASTGRDFPSGLTFNHGGPHFDGHQSSSLMECPSSPKALNTGQTPTSMSLLPSMSSLHNLLSKLPSVTASEPMGVGIPSPPSILGFSSSSTSHHLQAQRLQHPQQAFPRHQQQQPMSPSSSSGDSPVQTMAHQAAPSLTGDQVPSPGSLSPSPTRSQPATHQHLHIGSGNIQLESGSATIITPIHHHQQQHIDNNGRSSIREPGVASTSQPIQQLNSMNRSSRSNFSDSSPVRDHHFGHHLQRQAMGPPAPMTTAPPKDRFTSFLDSFDQDSLTDLDLQDTLENSETYNSFLSEII